MRIALALLLLVGAALAGLWQWTPGMAQYEQHRAPQGAGSVTATWLGVTALLLRDTETGSAVMVDPFFSRPPGLLSLVSNREIAPDEILIREWLARLKVEKLDAVMVSHSHYDHGMDAGVVARLTGATLLGSESTANIGRGSKVAENQLAVIKPGQPVQAGAFRITFVESRHAGATGGKPLGEITQPLALPAHYLDYRLGGAYSILIEHAHGTVLHHGSAGYLPGALQGRKADVVFLGVALLGDLPEYLRQVVDAVGAKRVIPAHWDDFTRPLSEPLRPFPVTVRLDRFFDTMTLRPDLRIETLSLAEPVTLF